MSNFDNLVSNIQESMKDYSPPEKFVAVCSWNFFEKLENQVFDGVPRLLRSLGIPSGHYLVSMFKGRRWKVVVEGKNIYLPRSKRLSTTDTPVFYLNYRNHQTEV